MASRPVLIAHCAPLRLGLDDALICNVVLVDIRDVRHGFLSDLLGGDEFDFLVMSSSKP